MFLYSVSKALAVCVPLVPKGQGVVTPEAEYMCMLQAGPFVKLIECEF